MLVTRLNGIECWARPSGLVLQGVVVSLVGLTGILKLADLDAFWASLATWRLLPIPAIDALSIMVPLVEVLIAGLWFACGRRTLAVTAAAVLIVLATALFVAHLVMVGAPKCNCFGIISRYLAQRDEAATTVVRNVLLLAALAAGSWLVRGPVVWSRA